jgi:hypothetical protein
MTIEATLTRELNIRFIDARALATEAKLNLGVQGYPSQQQDEELIGEAMSIFLQRPREARMELCNLKSDLDAVKIPIIGLLSSSVASTAEIHSDHENSTDCGFTSGRSAVRKEGFRIFRRR